MAKLLLIKVKSYDLLYLLSRMNHKAGLAEHTVPLNPLINYHYTHIVATLVVRAFSDAPTYHIVVVVVLVAAGKDGRPQAAGCLLLRRRQRIPEGLGSSECWQDRPTGRKGREEGHEGFRGVPEGRRRHAVPQPGAAGF